MASSKLNPKACMAKEVSAARPRRADWSQVLSSVLNIKCSSGTDPLPLQTPAARDLILSGKKGKQNKDRVCTRSSRNNLELKLPARCRYCFGGVVAGGLVTGAAGLLVGTVAGFTGF